ncbi:MAG: 5'/3'-nucleotidase SurE [Candidatus Omnitrophica bacterium]|nr:5'/3'-nucleotidase SurE [Candidatus Omnitrophota bacterium]
MKTERQLRILLTNDDGIYAEGIYTLEKALSRIGEVTVVAPEAEQSAVGHAITMASPLRVKKAYRRGKFFGYAVTGTPADCVKIAIRSLLKRKPGLIVSGINHGPNTGFSVLYSGTVSGATEGAILGFPSIAVSLGSFKNQKFTYAAAVACRVAKAVFRYGLPQGTFLNVNVPDLPPSRIKGLRVTTQGKTPIIESFDKRKDPRSRTYYWLTGEVLDLEGEKKSDIDALKQGYISVTPLHYDLTDTGFIPQLKNWKLF